MQIPMRAYHLPRGTNLHTPVIHGSTELCPHGHDLRRFAPGLRCNEWQSFGYRWVVSGLQSWRHWGFRAVAPRKSPAERVRARALAVIRVSVEAGLSRVAQRERAEAQAGPLRPRARRSRRTKVSPNAPNVPKCGAAPEHDLHRFVSWHLYRRFGLRLDALRVLLDCSWSRGLLLFRRLRIGQRLRCGDHLHVWRSRGPLCCCFLSQRRGMSG